MASLLSSFRNIHFNLGNRTFFYWKTSLILLFSWFQYLTLYWLWILDFIKASNKFIKFFTKIINLCFLINPLYPRFPQTSRFHRFIPILFMDFMEITSYCLHPSYDTKQIQQIHALFDIWIIFAFSLTYWYLDYSIFSRRISVVDIFLYLCRIKCGTDWDK